MPQSWKNLDLPIVTIAKPLEVALKASKEGKLRLGAVKASFPQGEAYFLVSNWPQTSHWLIPARLEGEIMTGDVSGVETSYNPEDNRPLLVDLAIREERGLIRYPLRGNRLRGKMSGRSRCKYLFDERHWYSGPVDRFSWNGQTLETIPGFAFGMSKAVMLTLQTGPRSLRYWKQLTYGLKGFERQGDTCLCTIQVPEGAPEVLGLSLHRLDGEESTQQFFPARQEETGECTAVLPLHCLPMDGAEYALSVVCRKEGEVLYHAPLSVIDSDLHQRMEEQVNEPTLREEGGRRCCLRLDDTAHPSFVAAADHPDRQQQLPGMPLKDALEQQLLPEMGHCGIRDLGGSDWHWRIELPNITLSETTEVWVTVTYRLDRFLLPAKVLTSEGENTQVEVDLHPLTDHIQTSRITRWDLTIAFECLGGWYHLRMRSPAHLVHRNLDVDPEYLDYTRCYTDVVGAAPMGDYQVQVLLCYTQDGYARFQTQDACRRYDYQIICRVEQAELAGRKLNLRIRCPNRVPGTWTGIALVHRYKLEADREMCFIPANKVLRRGNDTLMEISTDLSRQSFIPLYWDIRAVFQGADGQQYLVRALAAKSAHLSRRERKLRRWKKKIRRTFFSDSYRQGEDLSVSLYRTVSYGYALVCQENSPYSGFLFRIKERLALVINKLFRKQLAKKSIFLCYEKYCCMAQDNGFYFFRHCMEHDMERKMGRSIYFVIDKKQPDYKERLLPYKDHVIQFMSLKHMVYILAARLLISSDSKAHSYAWRAKESIILPRVEKRKKLVFLQHGVIALKRVEFYSKGTNAVQLFVTSNQREHDIIVREMAYPDEDVIITGLARWDVLEDKGWQEKHILIMPTWRNWLEEVSDEVFRTSDYYRSYMALLNDPRMAELLEQYDLHLDFYIHPKFRDYISNFAISEGGRVRLIPFGSEPLNELMMGCKMLITDYSSVCWDVYYQGKPVLFYQFDVEQYNETTGSYIDLETELFGDRATKPEELLGLIETYARNNFALPEKYAQMRPHMYAYLDHNNSQRTCEEIMKRHW